MGNVVNDFLKGLPEKRGRVITQRVILTGHATLAIFVLGSCSINFSDPLNSHLALVERSATESPVTESFMLTDLYGSEWTKFSIICPYTPYAKIKHELNVNDPPIPEHGLSDSENDLFLRDAVGNEQWIRFSRGEVDLCSYTDGLAVKSTSRTVEFSLDQPDGVWILSDLHD